MAAFYTREEVLEELFRDEDEAISDDDNVLNDEDRKREDLREMLSAFAEKNQKENFDKEFFVEKSVEVLSPIFSQAASNSQSDGKFFLLEY